MMIEVGADDPKPVQIERGVIDDHHDDGGHATKNVADDAECLPVSHVALLLRTGKAPRAMPKTQCRRRGSPGGEHLSQKA